MDQQLVIPVNFTGVDSVPHKFRGPITLQEISSYFHVPIKEAAQKLNICVTNLKIACRQLGIGRWPYRKLKGLAVKDPKDSALSPAAVKVTTATFPPKADRTASNPAPMTVVPVSTPTQGVLLTSVPLPGSLGVPTTTTTTIVAKSGEETDELRSPTEAAALLANLSNTRVPQRLVISPLNPASIPAGARGPVAVDLALLRTPPPTSVTAASIAGNAGLSYTLTSPPSSLNALASRSFSTAASPSKNSAPKTPQAKYELPPLETVADVPVTNPPAILTKLDEAAAARKEEIAASLLAAALAPITPTATTTTTTTTSMEVVAPVVVNAEGPSQADLDQSHVSAEDDKESVTSTHSTSSKRLKKA